MIFVNSFPHDRSGTIIKKRKVQQSEKGGPLKIFLKGSPRGRFEHSGVLPGAKLHARHDGNSEIFSLWR